MDHYYSYVGRRSIDTGFIIKMLRIGFLYEIKSEWRLEEKLALNFAYKWFWGMELVSRVSNHPTFSQFKESNMPEKEMEVRISEEYIELNRN